MSKCVVASGNFVWGMTFNGPFPSPKVARRWADCLADPTSWAIVNLDPPEDYEGDGNTVLVVGDVINGHNVAGPFDSPEAALTWCEAHPTAEYAHPAHLSPPD